MKMTSKEFRSGILEVMPQLEFKEFEFYKKFMSTKDYDEFNRLHTVGRDSFDNVSYDVYQLMYDIVMKYEDEIWFRLL